MRTWIVTGGAGFIGSNFVRLAAGLPDRRLVVFDKLTYAGSLENLRGVLDGERVVFVEADIADRRAVVDAFETYRPEAVLNFAAETHVDRSIDGPGAFVQTNVVGTFELLDAARGHWAGLQGDARSAFRFLHVSTDEVYGSLGPEGAFSEETPYAPNSPYAASKAGADHLVRAWFHTYGLPVVITNCSNNYGPYQFPEKLIPLMILNALEARPLPVYGDGLNVRDWLYVGDHCSAIRAVLAKGRPGEVYNIGGRAEMTNLAVVKTLCALLDTLHPGSPVTPHEKLITYVKDRPGHDRRYAMNADKLERELGWRPAESFESGIEKTVRWYLDNTAWTSRVASGAYRDWVAQHYSD